MAEIKPIEVDGEKRCSRKCPFFQRPARGYKCGKTCQDISPNQPDVGLDYYRGDLCIPAILQERDELKAEVERLNAPCPACNGTGSVDDPGSGNTVCPECTIDACIDKAHKYDDLIAKLNRLLNTWMQDGYMYEWEELMNLLQSFGEVE